MAQITSREKLEQWLKDKPIDWAQVIVARAALRVLPYAFGELTPENRIIDSVLPIIRAIYISWAARNFPAYDMAAAAGAAAFSAPAGPADAARAAAYSAAYSGPASAADAARAVEIAADAAYAAYAAFWANINHDCEWLDKYPDSARAAQQMTSVGLWQGGEVDGWRAAWEYAAKRLLAIDNSYQVWIDWCNLRFDGGNDMAFKIPGDHDRTEDKAILARLADATNEDFWDKGATYVNTTLQRWLEEARARVAPKTTPPQLPGATAYGVDNDDKVDRLPATDQQHLRDSRDQQQIYKDVREAAEELQREGQRLGERLEKALGRLLHSMPENFADAECYSVWRDGNALRRIHLAHRAVADGKDPDDKRLDPAMAQMLGGVLDLYNQFAFGDDGLRKKDEDAVPPQERAKAKDEAVKAAPLIEAVLKTPEIITDTVRDDLIADKDDQALPEGDPYDDQALSQSNKVKRNIFAALLSGAAKQIKQSGKSVREGAERAVGALMVSDAAGVTKVHQPILAFVTTHLASFKTYAATAYANSLQWLWDIIGLS